MFAENYLQRRDQVLQYYQQSAQMYERAKAEEMKHFSDEKGKIQNAFVKEIGEIEGEFQKVKQIQDRALLIVEQSKWSGHQQNGTPTILTTSTANISTKHAKR